MQIQPAAAAVLVAYLIADAALVAVAFGTATSAVGTSGCKIEIETLCSESYPPHPPANGACLACARLHQPQFKRCTLKRADHHCPKGGPPGQRPPPSPPFPPLPCTGASANLEQPQCAYLQAQFLTWNMTRYGCNPTDPCSCDYPGGSDPDNYITCTGEGGRNTTVTHIKYGDFDTYNTLKGTIHEDVNALTDLVELDLCCNEMTGIIPDSITKLTKLQILSLSDNYLNGTLPESIGDLRSLRMLNVENNYLSGGIPASFSAFVALNGTLINLSLNCNRFTGVLPSIDWQHITLDPGSPTGRNYDCFLSSYTGDDTSSCPDQFAPGNNWSCPLPRDACYYCRAVCHVPGVNQSVIEQQKCALP